MDLISTPVLVRCLLGPLDLSEPTALLRLKSTPIIRYNPPLAAHPPSPCTHPIPLLPVHPLYT